MTRGVSCALATCIATSSEPKVKTMNERVSVMTRLEHAPGTPSQRPAPSGPTVTHWIEEVQHAVGAQALGDDGQDRHDPQGRAQVAGGHGRVRFHPRCSRTSSSRSQQPLTAGAGDPRLARDPSCSTRCHDAHYAPGIGTTAATDERQALYGRIVQQVRAGEIQRSRITRDDVMGGIASFWLVFFASLPAAIPFLFIDDAIIALRISNAILLALLFVGRLQVREIHYGAARVDRADVPALRSRPRRHGHRARWLILSPQYLPGTRTCPYRTLDRHA